jgi:hypothetical protein
MQTKTLKLLTIILVALVSYTAGKLGEAEAATLSVSNVQANPGNQVRLPINLTQQTNITALQFTLSFDPTILTGIGVNSGSAVTDHTVVSNITPGQATVAIFSGSNAIIQANGGSVVDLAVQVTAASTATGTSALTLSNVVASDTNANSVPVTIQNGTFAVASTVPPGNTIAPLIAITSPGAGTTLSGSVTISAQATDDTAVVGVQFKVDGQNQGAEDTTSPYSISWDTTKSANGSHTLTAVARDAAGNQTTSTEATVTVKNGTSETTSSSVSITSPAANATVSGKTKVSATVSGIAGVVGVQFKLDGQNLGAEDTTSPYSVSWDTTKTNNGTHTLAAVARDAVGNQITSSEVVVTVNNSAPDTTAMGLLASMMQPGTWAELNTNGFNNGAFLESSQPGSSILSWANKGVWDPNSKRFLFLGAPPSQPGKFAVYDAQNNSWQSGPLPPVCTSAEDAQCIAQAFQHNALNPATGDFYYRGPFGIGQERTVYKYNIANGTWSTLPENDTAEYVQCCGALEYFPEMNGLVYLNGTEFTPEVGGLYLFSIATQKWSSVASNLKLADCCGFASYNPVHKTVLFGGGAFYDYEGDYDRNLYKLDSSGKVTKLNPTPNGLSVANSVLTVDPVSGKYLVFDENQNFYEYDVTTDTWTLQNSNPPIFTDGFLIDTVATPVSTYGVIMFVKYWFDQSKVYLYKHAANGAVPQGR